MRLLRRFDDDDSEIFKRHACALQIAGIIFGYFCIVARLNMSLNSRWCRFALSPSHVSCSARLPLLAGVVSFVCTTPSRLFDSEPAPRRPG